MLGEVTLKIFIKYLKYLIIEYAHYFIAPLKNAPLFHAIRIPTKGPPPLPWVRMVFIPY